MSSSRKPRRSRSPGSSSTRSAGSSAVERAPLAPPQQKAEGAQLSSDTAKGIDDVVVVHSPTADGEGMNVVRKRGDELSIGVVRPLEEGKPILGDVVKLKPRDEHPALFDVETELALQPERSAGPSRVSNSSYRKGWDSLWGGRRRRKTSRKQN
ncbi:MAG: hypothetical protein AB8H86_01295 [Polyangiales bacterium]